MAITSEQLRMNKRTGKVQLLRTCVIASFQSLLLVTAFILAWTPITKNTAVSTSNPTSSTFAIHLLSCDGDKPGFCPDGPFASIRTGGNSIFSTVMT